MLVLAFAGAILLATGLLMLPISAADGRSTGSSMPCCTPRHPVRDRRRLAGSGNALVGLRHVVLAVCMQLGGLGIMTFATTLGLLVARRLRLRTRIYAAAETQTVDLGDLRRILLGVVRFTFAIEGAVALVIALRWWLTYDLPLPKALWYGVFHSISGFNNTGLSLYQQNMIPFAEDPFILLPLASAVVLGGIGFPVLLELRRELRHHLRWSLNTKLVLSTTAILLATGAVFVIASEWSNRRRSASSRRRAGFSPASSRPR